MTNLRILPIPLIFHFVLLFFQAHPSKDDKTKRIPHFLIPVTDASIHSHLSNHRRLKLPVLITAAPSRHRSSDPEEDDLGTGKMKSSSSILSHLTVERISLCRTKSSTKFVLHGFRGGAYSKKDPVDDTDDDDDDDDFYSDDNDDGWDHDANVVMDETTTAELSLDGDDTATQQQSSSERQQKTSRLSLSGPFRMNELTTYEASREDETPKSAKGTSVYSSNKSVSSPLPTVTRNGTPNKQSDVKRNTNKVQDLNKKKSKKRTKTEHSFHGSSQDHRPQAKNNVQKKPDAAAAANDDDGNTSNKRGYLVGGGAVSVTKDNDYVGESKGKQESSLLSSPTTAADSAREVGKKSSPIDLTDVAQLWWVNMWTHQLSDLHSVDEDKELLQDDEEKLELEDEEVQEQLPFDEEVILSSPVLEEEPISSSVSTADIDDDTVLDMGIDLPVETIVGTASRPSTSFVSTGAWVPIDNLFTLGLASKFTFLRPSRQLRLVRKLTARVTGFHGILSGKPRKALATIAETTGTAGENVDTIEEVDIEDIHKRIAAIEKAREGVERARAADEESQKRRGFFGGLFRPRIDVAEEDFMNDDESSTTETLELPTPEEVAPPVPQRSPEEIQAELERMKRVREIDRLIVEGQAQLKDLICEKDVLQRRPNPLFDYKTTETVNNDVNLEDTTDESSNATTTPRSKVEIQASRKINFPPDDVVAEYLEMMISTRRLTKMNHTYLWKESETDHDEEESIGDDLFTPSVDARRLYEDNAGSRRSDRGNGNGRNVNSNGGGGSWLLRQSIGNGPSLGEKIGQAAETAAYKAVCAAVMSFMARALSSLHGINVLKHSDIRLVLEQAPDLPPVGKDGIIPGSSKNYAEETIKTVMRSKARRSKNRSRNRFSEDSFVQRDAVTEMLLSHVQISAPLLKLFPLAWQRALLGNILTLSTSIISDFVDGLYFQILGHQLSFAFRPITEEDMIQHFRLSGGRFNNRRHKPAEFEAAVRATAEDLSEELKFLDRWHERALGSGVLRTQIANMIARIVLTLTDEVLSGARMDLWSAQAGGPRMLACLEYRTEDNV
jgi:hypothetical protein